MSGEFLVCIDPGHPSETSAGARAHGLSENRINWQIAQQLAGKLSARKIRFVLTKRRENEKVTNRRRAEIANDANASLFLRLHCDVGGGRGFTFYYPDQAGTKDGVTGPPAEIRRASRQAAQILYAATAAQLKNVLPASPVKTDARTFVGKKQHGVLTGSIFARVPTVLIEMGVLSNKADARVLSSAAGQEKIADALAAAIAAWQDACEQDTGSKEVRLHA